MKYRVKWAHVYKLYEAIEPYLKISLPLEALPKGRRILVLSPHIDDETIGCGGTLSKHSSAGHSVTVLFLADCTEERKNEAEEAGKILGISKKIYWEYQSKTLDQFPEIIGRLSEVIKTSDPDLVYIPSFVDRHNDHVTLNYYFSQALKNLKSNFMIYSYEVWTTLIPNVVVDISDQIEIKKKAIACYSSQMAGHHWIEGTVALNRYRGTVSNAKSHGDGAL